jgi:FKBP-type peptidyl-prolyl cis-trans isomerase
MKSVFNLLLVIVCLPIIISSCLNGSDENDFDFQAQWVKDTTIIGSYLRTKSVNALTDASGVRFIIDQQGLGYPPKNTSKVTFKYKGRLLPSETLFDEGTLTGNVTDYIPGFQVGLMLMPEGSKARIYVPSGYAYGTNGSISVPPNANLIFELELVDIITPDAEKTQLASDTVAIDNFLTTNAINAIKDKSGIRYVITEMGTGAMPTLYSKVKLTYTGRLLSDNSIFFSGTNVPSSTFDSRVINYWYGFQAALPKIPEGSKVTIYIPSTLGFGSTSVTSGTVNVPANSNLKCEVELVDVLD